MSAIEEIEVALARLPDTVLSRSGSVFYSGPSAFSDRSNLYVLGLNPGGSPKDQAENTVRRCIENWNTSASNWSSYLNESWEGKNPGTHGMQPRMLHMFKQIGLNPQAVPASNVAFVRSPNEASLAAEKGQIIRDCWPVHATVIDALSVNTILCLGATAGAWVRERLDANNPIGSLTESNNRGWTSVAHSSENGMAVVTVTHPGRADWRNPQADPSPLIRSVIQRNAR